jgi:hypothetical protein
MTFAAEAVSSNLAVQSKINWPCLSARAWKIALNYRAMRPRPMQMSPPSLLSPPEEIAVAVRELLFARADATTFSLSALAAKATQTRQRPWHRRPAQPR